MDDLISRQSAIDVEGLDEEIRCQMCKNQMKTDKGCDGNCKYDEKLYEKIIQILNRRIKSLPSAEPKRESIKWIPHESVFGGLGERVYTCDKCGHNIGFHVENFCPNCGGKYER